jgi:hypothetical protein
MAGIPQSMASNILNATTPTGTSGAPGSFTAFAGSAMKVRLNSTSNVTLPASSALSWTNGSGGSWSIQSFDLTDSAAARSWFGDFNGAPISIANGNTFTIAVGGISIGLS